MSVLFMGCADLQNTNIWTWATCSTSTTYARTGSRSFEFAYNEGGNIQLDENYQTLYCRFALYRTSNSNEDQMYINDVGNRQITLYLDNDSTIKLYRDVPSANLLATATKSSNSNKWDVYEFKVVIDNSSGEFILKQNGIEIMNFSGDTQVTSNAYCSIFGFYNGYAGTSVYYDDVIVRDDDWPGMGGLYVLSPNAGSSNEGWTASAGNPEDCVDELPVSYTDYISADAAVSDVEHLVGIESLSITPESIGGVGVFASAKIDAAGTANARTMLKSGATTVVGSSIPVLTDEDWLVSYYHQNPDGDTAWGSGDIGALEVGIETQ